MQVVKKYLIETDVLTEHLVDGERAYSTLIDLMKKGICYTTVINASELLFAAKSEDEKNYVRKLLNSLKVLGLNSRYALSVTEFSETVNTLRDALFSVVADLNKLPIVTYDTNKFSKTKLKIFHPKDLRG